MQKNTGGLSSVINQFKTQEGSIDFNKMIDTAGQMMNSSKSKVIFKFPC